MKNLFRLSCFFPSESCFLYNDTNEQKEIQEIPLQAPSPEDLERLDLEVDVVQHRYDRPSSTYVDTSHHIARVEEQQYQKYLIEKRKSIELDGDIPCIQGVPGESVHFVASALGVDSALLDNIQRRETFPAPMYVWLNTQSKQVVSGKKVMVTVVPPKLYLRQYEHTKKLYWDQSWNVARYFDMPADKIYKFQETSQLLFEQFGMNFAQGFERYQDFLENQLSVLKTNTARYGNFYENIKGIVCKRMFDSIEGMGHVTEKYGGDYRNKQWIVNERIMDDLSDIEELLRTAQFYVNKKENPAYKPQADKKQIVSLNPYITVIDDDGDVVTVGGTRGSSKGILPKKMKDLLNRNGEVWVGWDAQKKAYTLDAPERNIKIAAAKNASVFGTVAYCSQSGMDAHVDRRIKLIQEKFVDNSVDFDSYEGFWQGVGNFFDGRDDTHISEGFGSSVYDKALLQYSPKEGNNLMAQMDGLEVSFLNERDQKIEAKAMIGYMAAIAPQLLTDFVGGPVDLADLFIGSDANLQFAKLLPGTGSLIDDNYEMDKHWYDHVMAGFGIAGAVLTWGQFGSEISKSVKLARAVNKLSVIPVSALVKALDEINPKYRKGAALFSSKIRELNKLGKVDDAADASIDLVRRGAKLAEGMDDFRHVDDVVVMLDMRRSLDLEPSDIVKGIDQIADEPGFRKVTIQKADGTIETRKVPIERFPEDMFKIFAKADTDAMKADELARQQEYRWTIAAENRPFLAHVSSDLSPEEMKFFGLTEDFIKRDPNNAVGIIQTKLSDMGYYSGRIDYDSVPKKTGNYLDSDTYKAFEAWRAGGNLSTLKLNDQEKLFLGIVSGDPPARSIMKMQNRLLEMNYLEKTMDFSKYPPGHLPLEIRKAMEMALDEQRGVLDGLNTFRKWDDIGAVEETRRLADARSLSPENQKLFDDFCVPLDMMSDLIKQDLQKLPVAEQKKAQEFLDYIEHHKSLMRLGLSNTQIMSDDARKLAFKADAKALFGMDVTDAELDMLIKAHKQPGKFNQLTFTQKKMRLQDMKGMRPELARLAMDGGYVGKGATALKVVNGVVSVATLGAWPLLRLVGRKVWKILPEKIQKLFGWANKSIGNGITEAGKAYKRSKLEKATGMDINESIKFGEWITDMGKKNNLDHLAAEGEEFTTLLNLFNRFDKVANFETLAKFEKIEAMVNVNPRGMLAAMEAGLQAVKKASKNTTAAVGKGLDDIAQSSKDVANVSSDFIAEQFDLFKGRFTYNMKEGNYVFDSTKDGVKLFPDDPDVVKFTSSESTLVLTKDQMDAVESFYKSLGKDGGGFEFQEMFSTYLNQIKKINDYDYKNMADRQKVLDDNADKLKEIKELLTPKSRESIINRIKSFNTKIIRDFETLQKSFKEHASFFPRFLDKLEADYLLKTQKGQQISFVDYCTEYLNFLRGAAVDPRAFDFTDIQSFLKNEGLKFEKGGDALVQKNALMLFAFFQSLGKNADNTDFRKTLAHYLDNNRRISQNDYDSEVVQSFARQEDELKKMITVKEPSSAYTDTRNDVAKTLGIGIDKQKEELDLIRKEKFLGLEEEKLGKLEENVLIKTEVKNKKRAELKTENSDWSSNKLDTELKKTDEYKEWIIAKNNRKTQEEKVYRTKEQLEKDRIEVEKKYLKSVTDQSLRSKILDRIRELKKSFDKYENQFWDEIYNVSRGSTEKKLAKNAAWGFAGGVVLYGAVGYAGYEFLGWWGETASDIYGNAARLASGEYVLVENKGDGVKKVVLDPTYIEKIAGSVPGASDFFFGYEALPKTDYLYMIADAEKNLPNTAFAGLPHYASETGWGKAVTAVFGNKTNYGYVIESMPLEQIQKRVNSVVYKDPQPDADGNDVLYNEYVKGTEVLSTFRPWMASYIPEEHVRTLAQKDKTTFLRIVDIIYQGYGVSTGAEDKGSRRFNGVRYEILAKHPFIKKLDTKSIKALGPDVAKLGPLLVLTIDKEVLLELGEDVLKYFSPIQWDAIAHTELIQFNKDDKVLAKTVAYHANRMQQGDTESAKCFIMLWSLAGIKLPGYENFNVRNFDRLEEGSIEMMVDALVGAYNWTVEAGTDAYRWTAQAATDTYNGVVTAGKAVGDAAVWSYEAVETAVNWIADIFHDIPDDVEEIKDYLKPEENNFKTSAEFAEMEALDQVKDIVRFVEVLNRYQRFSKEENKTISISDIPFYYAMSEDGKLVKVDASPAGYSVSQLIRSQRGLLRGIKTAMNGGIPPGGEDELGGGNPEVQGNKWDNLPQSSQKIINDWIAYAGDPSVINTAVSPQETISTYGQNGRIVNKTANELGFTTWGQVAEHYKRMKTQ